MEPGYAYRPGSLMVVYTRRKPEEPVCHPVWFQVSILVGRKYLNHSCQMSKTYIGALATIAKGDEMALEYGSDAWEEIYREILSRRLRRASRPYVSGTPEWVEAYEKAVQGGR
jgi:hypothetical protein